MGLGIVADAHLTPDGTGAPASQSEHENGEPAKVYELALQRCVEKGVDGLVLLGDLSRLGDDGPLETGVGMAAGTGLPVWAVSGNHDCGERVDALKEAVDQVGARNVRLLAPAGVAAGEGLRIAGVSVTSGDHGYTASPVGGPDVSAWGDECVVWLTHYPMISFAEDVWEAGFVYGDDLEDLDEVARPLLERTAPTVVVSGHLHLRDTRTRGCVLQVSCAALVEPPFEVTLLDVEEDGGRVSVLKESVQVLPSPVLRLPTLSPAREECFFEKGSWQIT